MDYFPGIKAVKGFSVPFALIEYRLPCEPCLRTGYRGRLGIFEIIVMDEGLRALILTHADAGTVREYAEAHGVKNLREDGAAKVMAGLTTTEEVLRVSQQDEGSA